VTLAFHVCGAVEGHRPGDQLRLMRDIAGGDPHDGNAVAMTGRWLKFGAPDLTLYGARNHLPHGLEVAPRRCLPARKRRDNT
jgi:hypothetical protein